MALIEKLTNELHARVYKILHLFSRHYPQNILSNIHKQHLINLGIQNFHLLRVGGLGGLETMISVTRFLLPKKDEVFPPWQGMQYMHDMFDGRAKLEPLDNGRYPGLTWTTVRDVLEGHERAAELRRRAS